MHGTMNSKTPTLREDQKGKKRKNSSDTFDHHGTTHSKGAHEKQSMSNDPDGEHRIKLTKANPDEYDGKRRPQKT